MKKFLAFLASLFRSVPADKNFRSDVLSVYPNAIISEDLLPASNLDVTVVVLPGCPAGFPTLLAPFVSSGDGVLTVVVTGKAADYIAGAVGVGSLVPDAVRSYLVGLLKTSGVAAHLAGLATGAGGAVVVSVVEAAAPFIVNALEAALGGYNGCVAVK